MVSLIESIHAACRDTASPFVGEVLCVAEQEVERLREALEDIANHGVDDPSGMKEIATEALKEPKK